MCKEEGIQYITKQNKPEAYIETINPERQGDRSIRGAISEGPSHNVDSAGRFYALVRTALSLLLLLLLYSLNGRTQLLCDLLLWYLVVVA